MARSSEPNAQFERRKADHIRLSLSPKNEATGSSGLGNVQLLHEALPDLDFNEIQLETKSLGQRRATPFLISSMTAGHVDSLDLNLRLARAAAAHGWRMGVGSQRRELGDKNAATEWRTIRRQVNKVSLLGNIGLAQVIGTPIAAIQRLVDALEAEAMIVHLNPLQECFQPEGTPRFKGGLKALENLVEALDVPVVVKETGCGFSRSTLKRLRGTGVSVVDVSGLGGTHWGRIEGDRGAAGGRFALAATTFADWGISTVDSVLEAVNLKHHAEVWASGGVRSGLDAAKLLALGAKTVGFAKPILEAALAGERELDQRLDQIAFELKTALFCTGCASVHELQKKKVWKWRTN